MARILSPSLIDACGGPGQSLEGAQLHIAAASGLVRGPETDHTHWDFFFEGLDEVLRGWVIRSL